MAAYARMTTTDHPFLVVDATARYDPTDRHQIAPTAVITVRQLASVHGSMLVKRNARVTARDSSNIYSVRVGRDAAVEAIDRAAVQSTRVTKGSTLVVHGSSRVQHARVTGYVEVLGMAHIGQRADLASNRHYLTMGPVGSENRTVTAYRTLVTPSLGQEPFWTAMVRAGCFVNTIERFVERIEDPGEAWPYTEDAARNRWQADYRAFAEAVQARVAQWQLEAPTAADVEFWANRESAYMGVVEW